MFDAHCPDRPLAESVPPQLYGGTERIVSYLTEELVALGHEVTLFASADSQTSARLVGCARTALRLDPTVVDALPYHLVMLEEVRRQAGAFDVLHFHVDLLSATLQRALDTSSVTTLHGRLDLPDLVPFYRAFSDISLVSISDAQRRPMPPVRWMRTIHHGLPPDLLSFHPQAGGYLAFLGMASPSAGCDLCGELARDRARARGQARPPEREACNQNANDISSFDVARACAIARKLSAQIARPACLTPRASTAGGRNSPLRLPK